MFEAQKIELDENFEWISREERTAINRWLRFMFGTREASAEEVVARTRASILRGMLAATDHKLRQRK